MIDPLDRVAAEEVTEVGDVRLECVAGRAGRFIAPQGARQQVDRHDVADPDGQTGQDRARLRPPDGLRPVGGDHVDRSEDSDRAFHHDKRLLSVSSILPSGCRA